MSTATRRRYPAPGTVRGMRWMARYVDDEGHERTKAFDRKADAQVWLDSEITAKLATGTYVAPQAGLITVAEVYASWSASQGHLSPKYAATRRSAWGSHVRPQWGQTVGGRREDIGGEGVGAKMVADEVGVPTIENAFGLLRQVLGAAVEDRRIPRNPCEGVKLPKRKHADRGT